MKITEKRIASIQKDIQRTKARISRFMGKPCREGFSIRPKTEKQELFWPEDDMEYALDYLQLAEDALNEI